VRQDREHSGTVKARRWGHLFRRSLVFAAVLVGLVWLGFRALVVWLPFDPDALFTGEISSTVFDRRGRLLRAYLASDDQWRIAVPLAEISPWAVRATLAAEDRRFFQHGGVDWRAMLRAAWQNLRAGRIVSGASTLTMQVVGLADSRERTLARKLRQIVRAVQLERYRTKEEILELYLTNAPYGGNVRGIEAAAWRYFGKSARELAPAEAALLAGVPQSPERFRPDRFPKAAKRRALAVLQRMQACGYLSAEDVRRARTHLPEIRVAKPPVRAPHFCDFVHARLPSEPRVHTTLDLEIQEAAERLLREQLDRLRASNVTNAAAVVLHNPSGEVRALVGSADYWNPTIAGQVNGALAPRSAGSTLKPFIYALALQRRLICPTSVLADVPGLFSNYDPKNFDQRWRGLVPLDHALAWSLNIPAMQVLERLGPAAMLEFLDACGVQRTMPKEGEVGLTLAVGTCSVRLLELANAYAMLARGGVWKPYRISTPPPAEASRLLESARRWNRRMQRERSIKSGDAHTSDAERMLDEESCYYINKILSDDSLRDPADFAPELRGFTNVAWKTGTSNGYRDAWTVAYDADWTIGVWYGNFDGKPSPALVGGRVAAPVALQLLNYVRQTQGRTAGPRAWPQPPTPLRNVVICTESGELASENCPSTTSVAMTNRWAQQGEAGRCRIHRRALVDAETDALVCPRCLAGRRLKEVVITEWPPAVATWLRMQGRLGAPRPHLASCPTVRDSRPPHIVSPHDDETFIVTPLRPLTFQRVRFEATCDANVTMLFWFVDEELVGTSPSTEPLHWVPTFGEHTLRCVDDRGKGSSVTFRVVSDDEEVTSETVLERTAAPR